jgi:hypothetical protein
MPLIHWETMIREKFQGQAVYIALLEEIHQQRTKDTRVFNTNLKEIIAFIGFMEKELPGLFEKWQKSKK